jgi:hypothetical protein
VAPWSPLLAQRPGRWRSPELFFISNLIETKYMFSFFYRNQEAGSEVLTWFPPTYFIVGYLSWLPENSTLKYKKKKEKNYLQKRHICKREDSYF